jgi:hypothetical protein
VIDNGKAAKLQAPSLEPRQQERAYSSELNSQGLTRHRPIEGIATLQAAWDFVNYPTIPNGNDYPASMTIF